MQKCRHFFEIWQLIFVFCRTHFFVRLKIVLDAPDELPNATADIHYIMTVRKERFEKHPEAEVMKNTLNKLEIVQSRKAGA